jgi:tripartite-type tricarboxylate transporter receptor subunit TctC
MHMRLVRSMVLACAFAVTSVAAAQTYPSRPVRIVVPFAPGGATDIVTRVVAQKLNELWGQTLVVDNRAGAGGNIGADIVAKASSDGYTLLMASGSIMTANPYIFKKLPYSPAKDLVAITNVASGPQIIAVHPSSGAKTLKEFIALAKGKPRSLSYGSAGVATQTHLAAENFMHTAGIDLLHVPYKGEGPALADLVGGQIQMVTANLSAAIAFVQQGKLRGLAVTSRERVRQLPEMPAAAETLPGFENLGWFGFVAPAGMPRAIIDKVHQDTVKVLQSADIRTRFEQLGMVPVGNSPADFSRAIRDESVRWAKVIQERKLYVE